MLRLLGTGIILFSLFTIIPTKVYADRPCKDDVAKYCGDVEPGEGRIARCIAKNKDKFSPECRAAMTKARQDVEAIFVSCYEDQKKYCADIEPGQGRVMRCMREHREQLSDKCRSEVERVRQDWKK